MGVGGRGKGSEKRYSTVRVRLAAGTGRREWECALHTGWAGAGWVLGGLPGRWGVSQPAARSEAYQPGCGVRFHPNWDFGQVCSSVFPTWAEIYISVALFFIFSKT